MKDLALLCGCPVLMPSGERLEPDGFRERFLAECAEFPAQLATFVQITQAVRRSVARSTICAVIPTRYRPPELDRLLAVLAADGVCVHLISDPHDSEHRIHRMWNEGADAARAHGATYIAILNDDITMLPGTLPLLAGMCDQQWKLGLVYPDAQARWGRLPDDPRVVVTAFDSARPITGHCFMFRAETGVRFDESYHWWFGDNQFHKDVTDAGWLAGYAVGVPMKHREHASASRHHRFFASLIARDRELWVQRQAPPQAVPAAYGSSYR